MRLPPRNFSSLSKLSICLSIYRSLLFPASIAVYTIFLQTSANYYHYKATKRYFKAPTRQRRNLLLLFEFAHLRVVKRCLCSLLRLFSPVRSPDVHVHDTHSAHIRRYLSTPATKEEKRERITVG